MREFTVENTSEKFKLNGSNSTTCAIIATYNRADLIAQTITSILSQTRIPDEIIVVDDGSTDQTEGLIAREFGHVEFLRYVRKENGGKSTALNLALSLTAADYIWIMDDDDIAVPEALAWLEQELNKSPECAFVFGMCKEFCELQSGTQYFDQHWAVRQGETDWGVAFLEKMLINQPGMLVRRAAYVECGPFNESLIRSQDYEMTLRLVKDFSAKFLPKVVFYQRRHAGLRGAATDRFAAAESEAKWLKYDQIVFRWVRSAFTLDRFTPTFARNQGNLVEKRAALILRGTICAKRGLWDEACADFEAALKCDTEPFSVNEVRLLERTPDNPLSWALLIADRDQKQKLKRLSQGVALGEEFCVRLTRPILQYFRADIQRIQIFKAISWIMLAFDLLGFQKFVRRVTLTLKSD
jgi:glycosyltransferase involved in cell wall biosynthesis